MIKFDSTLSKYDSGTYFSKFKNSKGSKHMKHAALIGILKSTVLNNAA